MTLIQRSWLLLLLIAAFIGIVQGQETSTEGRANRKLDEEVLKVEDERNEALLKGDVAVLDRIFDDDFAYTSANGQTRTKAQLLDDIRSGNLKYNSLNHADVHVRAYGSAAFLSGRSVSTYVYMGKAGGGAPRRYMNVYFKLNGQWRLVARQETPIATQ
jgi:hypothetical protein